MDVVAMRIGAVAIGRRALRCWALWALLMAGLGAALLASAAHAEPASPQVVYGVDHRREVFDLKGGRARAADSTVALIEADAIAPLGGGRSRLVAESLSDAGGVCPEERFADQPTAAFCSGVLVGRDLVATAGHCIAGKGDLATTRFVFGYRMENPREARTTIADREIYCGAKLLAHQLADDGTDFAVVRLDRPVEGHRPLKIRRHGRTAIGTRLYVVGHPSGLPAKLADGARVLASNPRFFTANLDTYGGNSGSAVFNAESHMLVGLLVRGAEDYVWRGNCYASNRLPNPQGAEESTNSSRFAAFVPFQ